VLVFPACFLRVHLQIRKRGVSLTVAALLAAGLPAAGAQGVFTLICADQPGGPINRYLVINYDNSLVSFSDNPAPFPAQISLSQIVWQTPRAELPNGDVRFRRPLHARPRHRSAALRAPVPSPPDDSQRSFLLRARDGRVLPRQAVLERLPLNCSGG
jgi:hypothetical protein